MPTSHEIDYTIAILVSVAIAHVLVENSKRNVY